MSFEFLLRWIFAFSPIFVVLVLMIKFKWSGGKAGAAGWITAFVVSWLFFGATIDLVAYSQMKGLLLTLNVLYIIWAALLLYNVVKETGAIDAIGQGIKSFTTDKSIQLLIFGWVFASFLQGVAGYGVPIAVVAPLLAGMGYSPIVAVAVPAIGHSWSVTFGSMGASFQAIMAVSGLEASYLAPWTAVLLGLTTYLCGFACLFVYGGLEMVRHSAFAVIIIGSVMAFTQYFLSTFGMWTLGGLGASLAGIIACVLVTWIPRYKSDNTIPSENEEAFHHANGMNFRWALLAYLILLLIVLSGVIFDPIRDFLGQIKLVLEFPKIQSSRGWVVPAGAGKKLSVFGHGGALLFYSAVLTYLIYRAKGFYRGDSGKRILDGTINSGISTSIGIVTMVGFALIMDQSGMTYHIAKGVASFFGLSYPFFAPWIGLLGSFMTGSNTNSNVVFGVLQQQTATLGGFSAAIVLAAQTTGGSIGSMVAPAKILVGCSTVGLSGKEGPVLGLTIKFGLLITSIIGVIVFVAVLLG